MGQKVSRTEFEWVFDEEPHKTRRIAILKKYPEIKQLYGYDTTFSWNCTGLVFLQIASLFYLQDKDWPFLLVVGYCFTGVINHSLAIAQHEILHNLSFGHARPMTNRLFGIFCNLPLGFPFSIAFKKYHFEHHRFQGVDGFDPDLPTEIEGKLFSTTFGKLCWVFFQPLFYLIRPLMVRTLPVSGLEILNIVAQVTFNIIAAQVFGGKMVAYLIYSSLICMGLHPLAGHFVSEHYMYAKGFETYSYYGPLNAITWNVGYHNEHHDFPAIPGSKLPLVKKIAPEFYDDLPHHNSWIKVIYDFIMDPAIGPYARIKRKTREAST